MSYKIAVYGSLRVGEYNYKRFEKHLKPLCIGLEVQGFKLYSLGSYPGVKSSENDEIITVDIVECSEEGFIRIDSMEKGANYKPVSINIAGEDCIIYEYLGSVKEKNVVKHGDWTMHLVDMNKNELQK